MKQLLSKFSSMGSCSQNRITRYRQNLSTLFKTPYFLEGETGKAQKMAIFTFTVRVLSAGLALLMQIALARWMGAFEYGIYVAVWVWALILSLITSLGLPSAVLRFIPQYAAEGQLEHLRGILRSSRIVTLTVTTAFAILGGAVAWSAREMMVENHFIVPILLAAVCLPMMALTEVQDGIARVHDWGDLAHLPPYLLRPLLIFTGMALIIWFDLPATATSAFSVTIMATWVTAIVQFFMLKRRLSKHYPKGPLQYERSLWVKIAIPLLIVEGLFVLITNTDIIVLGWFMSPDLVAIYFAAIKLIGLIHFVYFAVRAAAAHKIAHYFTIKDKHKLETFVQTTVRWTFWPSLALSIIMIAMGKIILSFFGAEFVLGYPVLYILTIGVLARASIGPAELFLTMADEQNLCAKIYASTFFINLILNLLLIPIMGLYGAALATSSSIIIETICLYLSVRRKLDISCFIWSLNSSLDSIHLGNKER